MSINPPCPFCEKPVVAIVTECGGDRFNTTIIIYYHEDGETHFRVNIPKDRFPLEKLTDTVAS